MDWFTQFIDVVFGAALFINGFLFVPQIIRLFRAQHAEDLSLITFYGFCVIDIVAITYGFLHHDYILAYGYIFTLFTCGSVTMLGTYFRLFKSKTHAD